MKDKISILMIGVVIAIFLIGIADADTGGINLESDPSGAQIYVVSHLDVTKTPIYKGITPSLITVDAGTYDVTLNYMGYNYAISTFGDPRYDYLKNIFVSAGTANTSIPKVVLNSTSPGVELRIRTEPDGATAKIGNPPMDIGKTTISGILIANFWEGNPLTLTKEGFFY